MKQEMNDCSFQMSLQDSHVKVGENEDGAREILLVANTGKLVECGLPYPLMIDFEGVSFSRSEIPILMDHDTKARFGTSTELHVLKAGETLELMGETYSGPKILVKCRRTATSDEAVTCENDMTNGFPFQCSIGGKFSTFQLMKGKNSNRKINGYEMSGEYLWAKKSTIREVSICVFGVDDDTKVVLSESLHGGLFMDYKEVPAVDNTPVNVPEVPETKINLSEEAMEVQRIQSLDRIASKFQNLSESRINLDGKEYEGLKAFCESALVDDSITAAKFEMALQRASFAGKYAHKAPAPPAAPAVQIHDDEITGDMMKVALARELGCQDSCEDVNTGRKFGLAHRFGVETLEKVDRCKQLRGGIGLHEVMQHAIKLATGSRFTGNTTHSPEFLELAERSIKKLAMKNNFELASSASTYDALNVFDEVGHVVLEQSYRTIRTSWREWVKVISVQDFRPHKIVSVDMTGLLSPLGQDGTFERGGFAEGSAEIQTQTYGRIEGLTRNQMMDDNLGVFQMIFSGWSSLAARTYEELVYSTLMNNLTTMFPSTGSNYVGAGSVMSLDGLSLAVAAIGSQVDVNGGLIDTQPEYLLVPPSLKMKAEALMGDEYVAYSTSSRNAPTTRNHLRGKFTVISVPYLEQTALRQQIGNDKGKSFPNQSATQYLLVPGANSATGTPLAATFLNGREVPTVESKEADFERLGIQWRIYTDFGVTVWRPEFSIYATGANAT